MNRYLTAKLPGTRGIIKESPEDFFVEEIPLYVPCGEGEHLYLEVEKRGVTTLDMLQRLSRSLGVKEREIGYAGLKDARATTRQTVSIHGVSPKQVMELELEGIKILSARYHRNRLHLGHLAGNRFTVRIRQVGEGALEAALDILHVLQNVGVPNLFGEQRYGSLGNSHLIGKALLRRNFEEAARHIVGDPMWIHNERWRQGAERFAAGDLQGALMVLPGRFRDERILVRSLIDGRSAQQAVLGLPRKRLRLYLSAYQSGLFDRMVAMRLDTLDILWAGDFAYKHDNGACFIVENAEAEQARAERLEISPSAPLFGYKVTLARGQAGIIEESLLEKEGLRLEDFRLNGGLGMKGERRPLRVPLTGADVRQEGKDLLLSFILPRGSYATSVLREVMKSDIHPTA
jgi:tRNA pseudouridine13 synthase